MKSQKNVDAPEYKALQVQDEENNLPRSDGDTPTGSLRNQSFGFRIASRVGVTLAVVALVGAGVKISQWRTDIGKSHPGQTTDIQDKVVGLAAPCVTVTPPPLASLCPSNGQYFKTSQSCCLSTCGKYCGHLACQKAPAGYKNCCTSTFTKLCGSTGVVAPCKLPRTLAGAAQLVVNNLGNFNSNTGAAAALVSALSKLLGVPESDITAAIQQATSSSGGRRLNNGAVNLDYVIRVPPSNTALTGQAIAAKSDALKPLLQSELAAKGFTCKIDALALPNPVVQEPGVVAPEVVQTTSFAYLPFKKTQTWLGRVWITTNAVMKILDSAESRTALATALAQVLDVSIDDVEVLGLAHEADDKVDAAYAIYLPVSKPAENILSKSEALKPALQVAYNNAGIKAAVHETTFGDPMLSTTPAPATM